jgi:uncharacterized protein YccT (UPF0319 family)
MIEREMGMLTFQEITSYIHLPKLGTQHDPVEMTVNPAFQLFNRNTHQISLVGDLLTSTRRQLESKKKKVRNIR